MNDRKQANAVSFVNMASKGAEIINFVYFLKNDIVFRMFR
jgi:hypothetical protein